MLESTSPHHFRISEEPNSWTPVAFWLYVTPLSDQTEGDACTIVLSKLLVDGENDLVVIWVTISKGLGDVNGRAAVGGVILPVKQTTGCMRSKEKYKTAVMCVKGRCLLRACGAMRRFRWAAAACASFA
jgi:hypothetical protein